MPLYEYECQACKKRFEVIQKFSDALQTVCEDCGGDLKKLLSAPAIQFKGTGWYVTDYARSGKSDGDEGKKDEGKKDEGKKDSKKTEAKSETSDKSEKSSKSESKSDSSSDSKSTTSKSTESGKT